MVFPILTVIEDLKPAFKGEIKFDNIFLICVQHLVETTGSLFEALLQIGFYPNNIYLKGKIYSTNKTVEQKLMDLGIRVFPSSMPDRYGILREVHKKEVSNLWDDLVPQLKNDSIIIILDDGGLAIRYAPIPILDKHKVYGIEQTTYGLRFQKDRKTIPIVQVATSAAKTLLEPYMISRALLRKLQSILREKKPKAIGVIGYGHIGRGVANFLSKNYVVNVFDNNKDVVVDATIKIHRLPTIEELISKSDLIIGATGVDISDIEWDNCASTDKILISVSSHDTEYLTLIRTQNRPNIPVKNVLKNHFIKLKNGSRLTLFRGGTVANFDNSKESCKKNEIQLTRGLLFAAIIQILDLIKNNKDPTGHIKLSSQYQRAAVNSWLNNSPHYKKFYSADLIENFKNNEWIEANS